MKYLKYLIVFVFILLQQCIVDNTQRGIEFLEKAEKQYEKGNYEEVLKLLKKAANMNYGSCANSYVEIDIQIVLIKASTYLEMEEYQLARNTIDSTSWIFVGENDFDSLYTISYQREYGGEYLKEQIEKAMKNDSFESKMICNECEDFEGYKYNDTCIVHFTLENGKIIRISFPFRKFPIIEEDEDNKNKLIKEALLKSRDYQLLIKEFN